MRERLARFFAGRNGTDDLARFYLIVSLVLLIISSFTGGVVGAVLRIITLLLMVLCYVRIFSRDLAKRREENYRYILLRGKALAPFRGAWVRFRQRGNYKFFRCPSCRTELRVPRGKGRISIRCPKCGQRFERHT